MIRVILDPDHPKGTHPKFSVHTIMDKSLGTNSHLWRFFTRAKQTVRREFVYTCSAPPPHPPPTMLDKCTCYFSRVSTLYGGEGGGEGESRKIKTQKINAITQVSQGILSTIVDACKSRAHCQSMPKTKMPALSRYTLLI